MKENIIRFFILKQKLTKDLKYRPRIINIFSILTEDLLLATHWNTAELSNEPYYICNTQ